MSTVFVAVPIIITPSLPLPSRPARETQLPLDWKLDPILKKKKKKIVNEFGKDYGQFSFKM